ncbi:hypothetical protein Pan216_10600 [Planctomycetes bacterium Pan216]|uniref:Uncharacterized protein n=1 Tax=Kolteria novifilia TaxID=2527975 RepID=A0A518AZS9_9BACT|nr:hypothetical protein Pan216_10600 [Planctomycetes bacterium Pan216]
MRRLAHPTCLLLLVAGIGCHGGNQLVEAELRYQTGRAQELECVVQTQNAEILALRSALADVPALGPGEVPVAPETVYQTALLSKIDVGRATGARDFEGDGVYDGFQIQVQPLDPEGDALKVPGRITVSLFQKGHLGKIEELGVWHAEGEVLRESWRAGLFGSCYSLDYLWQLPPTRKNLIASARFTTPDGRVFESKREFQVPIGDPSVPSAACRQVDVPCQRPLIPCGPTCAPTIPVEPVIDEIEIPVDVSVKSKNPVIAQEVDLPESFFEKERPLTYADIEHEVTLPEAKTKPETSARGTIRVAAVNEGVVVADETPRMLDRDVLQSEELPPPVFGDEMMTIPVDTGEAPIKSRKEESGPILPVDLEVETPRGPRLSSRPVPRVLDLFDTSSIPPTAEWSESRKRESRTVRRVSATTVNEKPSAKLMRPVPVVLAH